MQATQRRLKHTLYTPLSMPLRSTWHCSACVSYRLCIGGLTAVAEARTTAVAEWVTRSSDTATPAGNTHALCYCIDGAAFMQLLAVKLCLSLQICCSLSTHGV